MKKNIGSVLGLYPTPLVVVGTLVEGRVNWALVGHLGIMGHDRIMISLAKPHYTNQGIKENKILSVNIVNETMLKLADMWAPSAAEKRINPPFFRTIWGKQALR